MGGSDFGERMLAEADEKEKERLSLSGKVRDLGKLARRISKGEEIEESVLRSGRRQREISRVRRLLCQVAVGKLGYPAAKVARFLGVTTSAVVRAAYSEDLPEMGKYSQVHSETTSRPRPPYYRCRINFT